MKKTNRWEKPDWGAEEPVRFTSLQMNPESIFTAILLGGIFAAILIAAWHLMF